LRTIKPQLADNPLGSPSGAGVIYGSSGGVFESALRTAYFQLTDKELSSQAIKNIRGNQGIRIKTIKIKNRTLKVCIVSGLKNAAKVIKEIKKFPQRYDIIEVMACPGGCIGGGGQPLPTTKKLAATEPVLIHHR
jgi:NADH-quinone oxidoreductase subunit G